MPSVKSIINSDIKSFADNFDEKSILYKIHENSETIEETINNREDVEINLEEEIPLAVRRYVLYKTCYDVLYRYYLNQSTSSSIDLGDFSISNRDFSEIKPLLEKFKDNYEDWKDKIFGSSNKSSPRSVLKAEGEYPLGERIF